MPTLVAKCAACGKNVVRRVCWRQQWVCLRCWNELETANVEPDAPADGAERGN